MPRNRPGHRRRALLRRPSGANTVVDGLSARTLAEIARLELSRNYLSPGEVSAAVWTWKAHMRQPLRVLWREDEPGGTHGDCCGDPREARELLGTVTRALSPRAARELRRVVSRLDGRDGRDGLDGHG
ncbi:hypothetical protein PV394_32155 [Streptomyces sp. NE06-03E]|uniref:hypothetical protein n=1 Tax=unclassified Streptomyces TaxID=2593676 RepID=UPI0029B90C98|nr:MULTISPECIES: hypothetical protein [unclassified Streptomyces]MDX3059734.1 hypothetical protein [Streptomyces sp. NE06-03E]WSS62114.1 hypothetical protein OG284_13155 [Streptomyces sp. NBC_01177]